MCDQLAQLQVFAPLDLDGLSRFGTFVCARRAVYVKAQGSADETQLEAAAFLAQSMAAFKNYLSSSPDFFSYLMSTGPCGRTLV